METKDEAFVAKSKSALNTLVERAKIEMALEELERVARINGAEPFPNPGVAIHLMNRTSELRKQLAGMGGKGDKK